jgi:hypothetical protein
VRRLKKQARADRKLEKAETATKNSAAEKEQAEAAVAPEAVEKEADEVEERTARLAREWEEGAAAMEQATESEERKLAAMN